MRYFMLAALLLAVCGCHKEQPQPQPYPQQGNYPQFNDPPPINRVEPQPERRPQRPIDPLWSEKTFEGPWKTDRNRKLDGIMKAHVTNKGDRQWHGRFWGTWQGVDFEYEVDFDGPLDNLVGRPTTIDGAHYQWSGSIVDGVFKGKFTSNRYDGEFELTEK